MQVHAESVGMLFLSKQVCMRDSSLPLSVSLPLSLSLSDRSEGEREAESAVVL
jgi:hypothetical protein